MGFKMNELKKHLTAVEEKELDELMEKYKNDDEYFAHMNRKVTTFMLLGGTRSIKGRPTPEQMLLALLVNGRF